MATEKVDEHMRALVIRGGIAGVLGATAMIVMMSLLSLESGGLWKPPQLIGAALFPEQPTGPLPILVGLALHLAVGAFFGVLFAILTRRVRDAATEGMLGIVYGAAVFAPMTYLVLPRIDPLMFDQMHHGVLFVAHLAYGLITALVLGSPARRLAAHDVDRRRTV